MFVESRTQLDKSLRAAKIFPGAALELKITRLTGAGADFHGLSKTLTCGAVLLCKLESIYREAAKR